MQICSEVLAQSCYNKQTDRQLNNDENINSLAKVTKYFNLVNFL